MAGGWGAGRRRKRDSESEHSRDPSREVGREAVDLAWVTSLTSGRIHTRALLVLTHVLFCPTIAKEEKLCFHLLYKLLTGLGWVGELVLGVL